MRNITVQDKLAEMHPYIQELGALSSLPHQTKAQVQRQNALMSIISAMKADVPASEIRAWEKDVLLRELGMQLPAQCRTQLGEEVEAEWRHWLSTGKCRNASNDPSEMEARIYSGQQAGAQSITLSAGAQGGYFVPTGFADRSFDVARAYDDLFQAWANTTIDTPKGGLFPLPSIDDTQNAATIISESSQSQEVTVANFSQRTLGAFKFSTGIVAFSYELEQDTDRWPWGAVLEKIFSTRMARGVSAKFARGSGVGECEGLLTSLLASGSAPIIASGSNANDGVGGNTGANSIGTVDLTKCLHALDRAYRRNAIWAMSDNTLLALESQLTKQGLPIVSFRHGAEDGGDYPVILGHRVAVCPSISDVGPSTNPIAIYAPEYFVVRRVPSSIMLKNFTQAPGLAEFGLRGAALYARYDCKLAATQNASRVPGAFIQCHS